MDGPLAIDAEVLDWWGSRKYTLQFFFPMYLVSD